MFVREDADAIAVLRLAHGKVSALDATFCEALTSEIEQIAAGPARGLVLTGTGSSFSAGVDLFQLLDGGPDYVRHFLPAMDGFFRALLTFEKPVVAAVNGHAIAGGCIMAAACDHRVMASGPGRIGVPELLVGVPFPRLPLEIVASRVSPSVLRQLVYSGRTVLPAEGAALGLVDEVVEPDQLLSRAVAIARSFAEIPPKTFALTKRALVDDVLDHVRDSVDYNVEAVEAWLSPEVHEAIRQYLAKTVKKSS